MKLTQQDLDNLNVLLNAAVIHGGDFGGPYYCNAKDFLERAQKFIESSDDDLEIVLQEHDGYGNGRDLTDEEIEKGKENTPWGYYDFIQIRFKR